MFFFGGFFIVWILMIIISMGMVVVYIFYLMTQSRILELCHPHTRKMNPGEVWMVFIPLFGIVWHFFVISRVADSLAIEFRNRNMMVDEARPGYNSGVTAQIMRCCTVIPLLNFIIVFVWVIMLLIYWSKMRGYKNMLEQSQAQFGGNPFAFQQAGVMNVPPPQYPSPNNPPRNPY